MSAKSVWTIARFGLAVGCIAATAACSQQDDSSQQPGAASNQPAAADSAAQAQPAAPSDEAEPSSSVEVTPGEAPQSSVELAESYDEELLERGEYLMEGVVACGNCHSMRGDDGEFVEGGTLGGNFVIEEPGFTAYAPNITPDAETGIGTWTDEEIIRAVREGIRPDGSVMGPPMAYPFYRDISDRDMQAIVAYIRNTPPIRNEVPASEFRVELPPNWGPPVESVPEPSREDEVEYGEYLAHTLGHCTDCHTPLVEGQHDFSRIGAGGTLFPMPFGYDWSVVAANITQHPELGIGEWTDEEIKRAITEGVTADGREMLPFMAFDFYANITDEDLDAIVAYLKTLPPATATPQEEH